MKKITSTCVILSFAVAAGAIAYWSDRKTGPIVEPAGSLMVEGTVVDDWFSCRVSTVTRDSSNNILSEDRAVLHIEKRTAHFHSKSAGKYDDEIDIDGDKVTRNGRNDLSHNEKIVVGLMLEGALQHCTDLRPG